MAEWLELDDHRGPFQHKSFYSFIILVRNYHIAPSTQLHQKLSIPYNSDDEKRNILLAYSNTPCGVTLISDWTSAESSIKKNFSISEEWLPFFDSEHWCKYIYICKAVVAFNSLKGCFISKWSCEFVGSLENLLFICLEKKIYRERYIYTYT